MYQYNANCHFEVPALDCSRNAIDHVIKQRGGRGGWVMCIA